MRRFLIDDDTRINVDNMLTKQQPRSETVVNLLLELNVLNLAEVERQLRIIASRAIFPQAEKWVMTVARNYIVNLSGDEAAANYEPYTGKKPRKGLSTDLPSLEQTPDWVRQSLEQSREIHFFDPVQVRRRTLWKAVENIVDWFNANWTADDPRLRRLDRMSFQEAVKQASAWKAKVDENPWAFTSDAKRVKTMMEFPNGWRIVKIISDIGLSREGALVGHCVGGSTYQQKLKSGAGEYYSLRDPENMPHATIEVNVRGDQRTNGQIKGKQNTVPVPEYRKMIRAFFKAQGWPEPFSGQD